MRKPKRIEVRKLFDSHLRMDEISGSAEDVYKVFKDAEQRLLDAGFLRVEFCVNYAYDVSTIDAIATRPETDKEYKKRIEAMAAERKKKIDDKVEKEAAQRELYEQLKKKFEK